MKQDGKLTITGILMILIVFYGGYVAVKIISADVMETQIAKEVKEKISILRGADFTEGDAMAAIIEIVKSHDVIFNDKEKGAVSVIIDRNRGRITYQLTYDVESNLIFTSRRKTYTIKDELASYR